ncbi:MAG: HAD hydrolase-like protein [Thermomicrobiales bacterium]|nr:HAD hydrolase-like protein [Thermomicrobiales bacterium]
MGRGSIARRRLSSPSITHHLTPTPTSRYAWRRFARSPNGQVRTLRYHSVLFDLDGTLTDPRIGITRCVQLALSRVGIEVADADSLTPYIGPPLLESFDKHHGLDRARGLIAIGHYRERFAEIGWRENELYPGIPELLAELHGRGTRVIVATSKPTIFAEQIVTHFGLAPVIDLVAGSNLDNTRVAKGEVIAHALAERPFIAEQPLVMVGDREHDIIGARQNRLDAIGVAYGYGDLDELRGAVPIAIAHDVAELAALLLG